MKFKVNPNSRFKSHFIKYHVFNFCRKKGVIDDVYKYHEHFLGLIEDNFPYQCVYIIDLFDWDDTKQGYDFWNKLDTYCEIELESCLDKYRLPNKFCPNFRF